MLLHALRWKPAKFFIVIYSVPKLKAKAASASPSNLKLADSSYVVEELTLTYRLALNIIHFEFFNAWR